MHIIGGGLVAGELHEVAVFQKGTEKVAVLGDGTAGNEHGIQKLLCGLLRSSQAKTPFDVIPQDTGHPHVELLDVLQGDQVVALQPVQGSQGQQVSRLRRLRALQASSARPPP